MMTITVAGRFDGGNPQDAAAIRQVGEAHYRVLPYSEDGDANYKFALHVRATNHTAAPVPLALDVDWDDLVYMEARSFVHVGRAGRWDYVPVPVEGAVMQVRLTIPPGDTAIGLSPAYGLADHQAFAARLPSLGLQRQVLGRSARGEEIEAFHAGRGPRTVLITARAHPYETAASFCVEGLLAWLGTPGPQRDELLAAYHLVVVPLLNPDGVTLGLSKRTAALGVDLSHESAHSDEPAAAALMRAVRELRPAGYLDLHGWMHGDEDGLHYVDDGLGARFTAALADDPLFVGNAWKGTRTVPHDGDGSPQHACAQQFDTAVLAVSYRWPDRTIARMRALGAPALRAFCAAIED
jgi:hypothetical protein